jgi:hypothetical protein
MTTAVRVSKYKTRDNRRTLGLRVAHIEVDEAKARRFVVEIGLLLASQAEEFPAIERALAQYLNAKIYDLPDQPGAAATGGARSLTDGGQSSHDGILKISNRGKTKC